MDQYKQKIKSLQKKDNKPAAPQKKRQYEKPADSLISPEFIKAYFQENHTLNSN